jgi:hypothetical protein
MGGMFTTVKVREGLAKGDFKDPGPFAFPKGQVAYEWTGESLNPQRAPTSRMTHIDPATGRAEGKRNEIILDVRKPQGGHGSH